MDNEEKFNLLVDALRFYAENRNVTEYGIRNDSLHGANLYNRIDEDEGKTARKALNILNIPYDKTHEPEQVEY